jgi:hypothetical protein
VLKRLGAPSDPQSKKDNRCRVEAKQRIVSRKENLYVAMARSVSLGRGERPECVEQFIHAIPLVWVVLRRLPVLLCLGHLLAGIFYRFVHEPPLNG